MRYSFLKGRILMISGNGSKILNKSLVLNIGGFLLSLTFQVTMFM